MSAARGLPEWLTGGIARTMLADAPVPMGILNLEVRHVTVNLALARLYGREPDAVIGMTPSDLLGELGTHVEARCADVVRTRRPLVGHLVSGVPRMPSGVAAEVHWQVDAALLDKVAGVPGALMLLVADVTARTRAMRSLNEQRRALAYQASHDPVTGLANRFQLRQVLERHLSGRRLPHVFAIDLDGFKEINDRNGHAAGDHVLSTVARRLQAAVRGEDLVCRYGGDEFVVVTTEADLVAERMVVRLADVIGRPVGWQGGSLRVGASVGAAVAEEGDDVDDLLHRADEAMYRTKQQRRG